MGETRMEPAIVAQDLRYAYVAGINAVAIDRLSVPRGAITVLIGHNGCGKTTLLKLMNGLLPQQSGTLSIAGKPLQSPAGREYVRRNTVLVHQKPYLFRETVGGNIRYVLRHRGLTDFSRRVERSLREVDLPGFEHRRATQLSGGEKQRVALARAVAVDPRVLFLDEPTSNIDPHSRHVVEAVLRRLRDAGTTVVMSTHNTGTAYRLADELFSMENGAIQPPRMNVLRGRVTHSDQFFSYFSSGEVEIRAPVREAAAVTAVVAMEDVILSLTPLVSSAQNEIYGTVEAVVDHLGGLRVDLRSGDARLSALVTPYAVAEMGIAVGQGLYASFKASAVHLY